MITLYLNTANIEKIIISILINKEEKAYRHLNALRNSKIILTAIKELLTENNLAFSDLDSLEVYTGKGSFTGVRSGIAIANALSYALEIPVNGKLFKKDKTLPVPSY